MAKRVKRINTLMNPNQMYISKIHLENIRGIKELDIEFPDPNPDSGNPRPRMHTVIIGENGTCKTSLLRCIVIGLCDKKDASGLLSEDTGQLVSEDEDEAKINITLLPVAGIFDNGNIEVISGISEVIELKTILARDHDGQDILKFKTKDWIPANLLVCAYGVGRSIAAASTGRNYRIIDSAYNLFDYSSELMSIELTLRRLRDFLEPDKYENTKKEILKCLELKDTEIELPPGGGVVVSGPRIGDSIPLEGLADGYRLSILWILDLYSWAMRAGQINDEGGINGILLFDEVDKNLHPSLQTNILKKLNDFLPDLQIISTTHSPMVVLGSSPEEVVVLRRDGKSVVFDKNVPNFYGYSAEDVLVDAELFDTQEYHPDIYKIRDRYRQLISKKTRNIKESKELKSLTEEMLSIQMPEVRESESSKELKKLIKKYKL